MEDFNANRFSKKIVILVISLNVLFTIACFVLCLLGAELNDALIVAWFTFTGTELVSLAGIKITDTIKGVDINKEDIEEKPDE